MTTIWAFPTRILFGAGSAKQVGDEARAAGITRALIVTDPGVVRAGLCGPIEEALRHAGIAELVFSGVHPNPTEDDVEEGARAYTEHQADGVIALGGGSALDAGKLIALRSCTQLSFEELDDAKGGDRLVPNDVPPILTVPTTAGTGSEVGRSGVLTVRSTGRKTVIFSPRLLARAALLDPELTRSMPRHVTAATGFDALTHCIEAYLAKGDHPMADAIALSGIDLVAKNIERAVMDGEDLKARGAMMKAAMMGAVAFQKGLGACHSLAHPLSSEHDLHHGLANALCLPAVLRFNWEVSPDRVRDVGVILGGGDAAAEVEALRERVGLPRGLRAVDIREEHLGVLADKAIDDACHQSNPRPCSREDLFAMYQASL
jgi:alcohol dehydrogenase class IV